MRLRDLLDIPELRIALRAGAGSVDRPIRWVYVTELLDPSRYLSGNELVLTGMMWRQRPEDSDRFAAAAAGAGAAAVAAGTAVHGEVPADFVAACRRHGLPLVEVPIEVSFGTVSEIVTRRLSAERANGLASALGRHRRLVGAVAGGEGMASAFALARRDLGLTCWVISSTGRVVAGGTPAPHPQQARAMAAGFLAARRLPEVVRAAAPSGGGEGTLFTLLAVRTRCGHRMGSWFLACAGVLADHGDEAREAMHELATLAALEWSRLEEGRRVERRLAGRLIELAADGDPAAVAAQMRTCGMSPGEPFAAVTAGFEDAAAPADCAAALDELLHAGSPGNSPDAAGGRAGAARDGLPSRSLGGLAGDPPDDHRGGGRDIEPTAGLGPDGGLYGSRDGVSGGGPRPPGPGGRAPPLGDEAVALVPLGREGSTERIVRLLRERTGLQGSARPGGSDGAGEAGGSGELSDQLAGARARVAIGVSRPARGPDGLRAAIDEARHARRLAASRPGGVHVVTSDEICSHALLLASVPEGVRRSFRERLLGPLLDYDTEHNSDLVGTLRAFLDCSGSWNKCAARMHVHVNTLRYRIRRIEELTGRDLASLETRVDFFLALEAA